MRAHDTRAGFAGIALCCLAAVGIALVSQHRFGMQPCPWCVLQRALLVGVALACLPGLVLRSRAVEVVSATLVFGLAVSGIGAAIWQHFGAAASTSCKLTLADKIIGGLHLDAALPDVFEARASCADAAVSLLGISYDFWSLGLFTLVAIAASGLMRRRGR